jgi:hypothetical protein
MIARFDGQQVTRLEMVQTIKEHELTHRSQLSCIPPEGDYPGDVAAPDGEAGR